MNKEVTLQQIISSIILFLDRNKTLILTITLSGILIVILFQKLRPAYYSTNALVTSGFSAYERIPDEEEVLNQRSAINLINNLDVDIDKEDYKALAGKLNLSVEKASKIKFIEAEQLLRQDKDEKFHNTPQFQINLEVRDPLIIKEVEQGLLYYFNSNPYIIKYKDQYNKSNQEIITSIDKEINDLRQFRKNQEAETYMTVVANQQEDEAILSQIASLVILSKDIETKDLRLPLEYWEGFTFTDIPERQVLVWGTTVGVLSFFLSLIIALIREVKSNYQKR